MDILTEKIKNKIIEISNNNKNEEICGLVIKRFDNLLVFECENVAFHKKNHCVLNPLDYIKADKMGEIIAHFHSQDEDGYSNTDFINACGHNIFSIIYCKKNENFYIIDPKNKNYLNLDFKIGENDCFSLVRNFYKDRFNIIINNYEKFKLNNIQRTKELHNSGKMKKGYFGQRLDDGSNRTPEAIEKRKNTFKLNNHQQGSKNSQYGKPRSEETKRKIRESVLKTLELKKNKRFSPNGEGLD